MYELIKISDYSYYIQSPSKTGLIKTDETHVCLIDSGSDKDAGKKALKIINENGWALSAIYNTHSHADHIGGNKYLQSQTGCKIFAPGIECDFTNHPLLEPSFLYGGFPYDELRHKFIMAAESTALALSQEVLPDGVEIIPLPGHSFDMVGFRMPDGTAFIADALSSKETLDKYRIGFIYDVGAYLETLERIKAIDAKLFVPSHAEPTEDIKELADYNIATVNDIAGKILDICKTPICFDKLLKMLFDSYSLDMNFIQHTLVGSTVRSYLTWLKQTGKANVLFDNNLLLWERI